MMWDVVVEVCRTINGVAWTLLFIGSPLFILRGLFK